MLNTQRRHGSSDHHSSTVSLSSRSSTPRTGVSASSLSSSLSAHSRAQSSASNASRNRSVQRQAFAYFDSGSATSRYSRPLVVSGRRRRKRTEEHENVSDQTPPPAPWLITTTVGGLRGDPFNAYPIEPKGCVPLAIDHFVQTFIPERILRPFQAVPGIEQLAHSYFQLVINDISMFEATVAHVEAMNVAARGIRKPTKEVLHHHGQSLLHLQKRLADPVLAMEDVTLHIIINIMGTHFFFGELDQHQAHLEGLWSLVNMRGGLDKLGWNGSLKQAIETVTSFVTYQTKVETPVSTPNGVVEASTGHKLDYPPHPFSPETSAAIAKLPLGFSEVALNRTLSIQTIDLLLDVHEQDTLYPVSPTPNRHRLYTADKCLLLLRAPQMPELERMIVGGLLAYTVQSQPPESRTTVYDEALMGFLADLAAYTFINYEQPCLLWVVLCFAVIQEHFTEGSRVDFFHHTILRFKQSVKWPNVEKAVKGFLWTEERLPEWRAAWEEAIGSHKPDGYLGRTPSRSPETESLRSGSVKSMVMTPVLVEEEARQATGEVADRLARGVDVKIEERG